MRALIAIDSFKGSLSSKRAGEAVARGLGRTFDCRILPVADGGEGTLEAFGAACGGELIPVEVHGPLGEPARAEYLWIESNSTAVVEMARAAGLPLVGGRPDLMRSNTLGVGELIRAALDRGARRVLVGMGGSATNDFGAGVAAALGARFLDAGGNPLATSPAELADLARIALALLDDRLAKAEVIAFSDVSNLLLGPLGAAAVYGPQKGASAEDVEALERAAAKVVSLLGGAGERAAVLPGSGAAGGLGFGLAAFLRARILPGADELLKLLNFEKFLAGADVIITGEGRLDRQTLSGKLPAVVARLAREAGVPCVAICGSLGCPADELTPAPFAEVHQIVTMAASPEDSIFRAEELLELLARSKSSEIAALAG